jgi:hypothetical protein
VRRKRDQSIRIRKRDATRRQSAGAVVDKNGIAIYRMSIKRFVDAQLIRALVTTPVAPWAGDTRAGRLGYPPLYAAIL